MSSQAKADCRHTGTKGLHSEVTKSAPLPLAQPFRRHRASQAPGKLQGLIPGSVPRVHNVGTSQSQGSPETTAHHKGQEEAEVLARAEAADGRVGSGLGQMGSCPVEPLSVKRGRVPGPRSCLP